MLIAKCFLYLLNISDEGRSGFTGFFREMTAIFIESGSFDFLQVSLKRKKW